MAWILYTGTSRALYTGNTPSGPWRGDTYPVSLFSPHEDHDDREDYDDHNDQHDYFDDQNDDLEDHGDLGEGTLALSLFSSCQHSPVMANHDFRIMSGLKSFFNSNCGVLKSLFEAPWDTLMHKGVEEERNLPPPLRPNNVCEVIVGPRDSQCQLQSRAQCPQVLST